MRLKSFSYTIMIVLLVVATVFQCPCKIQTLSVSRALFPPEANPARWFTLLLVQWTPPPARMSVAWQLTSALPRSAEPHTQSVGPPTCLLQVGAIPLVCLSDLLTVQVTLSSDAVTNQATCEDAGGTFTAGLEIDAGDTMMAQFVVPTDGSLPTDGAVDVVLKSASGVEDTAFGGFTFDSTRPANLIDDAMTRTLSATPLTGKTDIPQNVTDLLMMSDCLKVVTRTSQQALRGIWHITTCLATLLRLSLELMTTCSTLSICTTQGR